MRKWTHSLLLDWELELPEPGAAGEGEPPLFRVRAVNLQEAEPRDRALGPASSPAESLIYLLEYVSLHFLFK